MRYVFVGLLVALCACSTPVPEANITGLSSEALQITLTPTLTRAASFSVAFDAAVNSDNSEDEFSYSWDFGDGTVKTGTAQESHTYNTGGSFTVTVTASNDEGSSSANYSLKLRPKNSPDVLILGFAGRCGVGCGAPFGNEPYLGREGTLDLLQATFDDLGYSSEAVSAAAIVANKYSEQDANGYFEVDQALQRAKKDWIEGYFNPTRLVFIGHSHGATWSSLLAYENQDVTFDYGIYLDAVCNSWERDNLYQLGFVNTIFNFYFSIKQPYPETLKDGACNVLEVGRRDYHLKDVVPDNVRVGVEARTKPLIALPDSTALETQGEICGLGRIANVADATVNVRFDGSKRDLFEFEMGVQNHCEVVQPDGEVMEWTRAFILEKGLR